MPLVDIRMVDQHTATMVNAAPVSTDDMDPPMLSNGLHWKLPLSGSLRYKIDIGKYGTEGTIKGGNNHLLTAL